MSDNEQNKMLQLTFEFERKHPELYEKPQSMAEVGAVFSQRTMLFHEDNDKIPRGNMSGPSHTDCWAGWCETLYLGNIPYDTLTEKDINENHIPDRIKLLILPNVTCLSDAAIKNIHDFVEEGGKVIITHQTGIKDETGESRDCYPFEKLTGANNSYILIKTADKGTVVKFKPIEAGKLDNDGHIFSNRYGKGEVITFSHKPGRLVCVNRHVKYSRGSDVYVKIDFSFDSAIAASMLKAVNILLEKRYFRLLSPSHGITSGIYKVNDHIVIHLVNVSRILANSGKTFKMPIPVSFTQLAETDNIEFFIAEKLLGAELFTPGQSEKCTLKHRETEDGTIIEVPARWLTCYVAVKCVIKQ